MECINSGSYISVSCSRGLVMRECHHASGRAWSWSLCPRCHLHWGWMTTGLFNSPPFHSSVSKGSVSENWKWKQRKTRITSSLHACGIDVLKMLSWYRNTIRMIIMSQGHMPGSSSWTRVDLNTFQPCFSYEESVEIWCQFFAHLLDPQLPHQEELVYLNWWPAVSSDVFQHRSTQELCVITGFLHLVLSGLSSAEGSNPLIKCADDTSLSGHI